MFKLKDFENTYIVAWTTTPWTLFSNMALCVNYSAVYDWIEYKEKVYICAKDLIHNLGFDKYKIIKSIEGEKLVGLSYEPLFDYVVREFKIITDRKQNYVIVDNNSKVGTGIVHIAPYYGEDDYRVFNNSLDIEKTNMLDENGMFIDKIDIVKNLLSTDKDTNDIIIKALKIKGNLLKTQVYKHSYPFCYRTDTPLIYKLTLSYFLKVPELKDQLLKNNEKINWFPKNIGNGRFKNWLENAREWCISRNRFFGTPLPLWVSDDGQETLCISSIDELTELANLKIKPQDIHRENIDDIIIISKKTGKILRNTKLVLDCWFESGMAGLARFGFPECVNKSYPVDFIAESLDQTRGWFYTLNVLSTALNHTPAFKQVIVSGLILAEDGKKMSKRLQNYTSPNILIDKYGADIFRLYMIGSPAAKAESFCFKDNDLVDITRKINIPDISFPNFIIL
jgi:isoleucyl-tRNA synthetase